MKRFQVVIGIVKNSSGQLLLSRRPNGKHLSGYWEFPGGKVESSESFKQALRRELKEEIAIDVGAVKTKLNYEYQYPDRLLHLQVFEVISYSNDVCALEGQELKWFSESSINNLQVPPANYSIMNAIQLPDFYMIACQSVYKNGLFPAVKAQLLEGISIIQFRAPNLTKPEYTSQAKELRDLCEEYNAKLISNCDLAWIDEIQPHGIHLTSARLREVSNENVGTEFFSASCHDQNEIELANQLRTSCVIIAPVQYTHSHPNNSSLGWNKFRQLCSVSNCPVYAMGGLGKSDLLNAKVCGAQGVAGIRLFQN